jgi:hypothetical protein
MSFYRTRFDRKFTDSRFSGPSASFVGPLDAFTANLAGSWSVARRLLSSYTGPLLRVRRSSDDNEQDIGFADDGSLDTAALLSFCGAGDGFVRTVYDQSGATRDFGQSTAASQPLIVSGGVVDVNEGEPSMLFDGTNDGLSTTSLPALTDWWGYIVVNPLSGGGPAPEVWALVNFPDSGSYRLWERIPANTPNQFNNSTGAGGTITFPNSTTAAHLLKGGTTLTYAKSSNGDTASTANDNTIVGGISSSVGCRNDGGDTFLHGYITEWAICGGSISAGQESSLWADLNNAYSTPIP